MYNLKALMIYAASAVCLAAAVAMPAAGSTTYKITAVSGSDQTQRVGTTLANHFVAKVTDSTGKPTSGVAIKWSVMSGGGRLATASSTTNSSGETSNALTLGTAMGNNKVFATVVATGANVIFGAVGTPGTAVAIGLSSGNSQKGTVGAVLPNDPAVMCTDEYGNPALNVEVDWTVLSGGGSVPYAYSLSKSGVATKALTLGTKPGTNTVRATIHGTSLSYTFSETALPGPVASLAVSSGNNQVGSGAGALTAPLTVVAADQYGNALTGVKVDWTANTSGDSFSVASSATNSSGLASSALTLGSAFGLHTATANVNGKTIRQGFVATEDVDAVVTAQNPATPHYVPSRFLGLSYQKSWISTRLPNASDAALVALMNKLGAGVLRIVAEAPFTPPQWDPNGPGLVYGTIAPSDLARLAALAKATNWKVLYGIQLVDNTPANAASEAKVAAQQFGNSLLGFEIGNEPDQYVNAVYGDPVEPQLAGYTWADYISTTPVYDSKGKLLPSWPAFASAIEAVVPNAPLTGPTGTFSWAINFAGSNQASKVSLLTRHYYALPPKMSPPPTMSQLLTPDPRVPTQFPQLAQAAAAANIPGGYRISECNSVAGAPVPGITNAFGAALWTIDFLFQNAVYWSTGVNFNGGGGYDKTSYSPIYDDGVSVTGIGPDYYGLLAAYSLLQPGAKLMNTQVTPGPSTFSAYAAQQTNGTTWFILSNKDPNNDITVSLTRPGSSSAANSLLLTAPSLTATSGFKLGGTAVGIDGSWSVASNPSLNMVGTAAVVTIPAHSAQIVQMY
jgi:hypothetical protein